MRYFWHFAISIGLLAIILFAFFGTSLSFGNKITYTDQVVRTEPTISFVDPVLGKPDAKVTVVNFGDYGCNDCAALDQTLIGLVADDFPNDLRIVWKDMPNVSQHKEAMNAAVAARCAGDQGKFWEYHTALMKNQNILNADFYTATAKTLELKDSTFSSCFNKQVPAPIIQQTYEEGIALGISATPTLYINKVKYTGAMDTGTLKSIIRQAINQK